MQDLNARRRVRVLTIAAGLVLGAGGVRPATAAEPSPTADSAAPDVKHLALVKIEIKLESGRVVKNKGQLVEWNEDAKVVIAKGDVDHVVGLKVVRPSDESRKVRVTLGYTRDGKPIVFDYTFSALLKRREAIRIEGGLAIAVTVVPKTIKVEPTRPKVDPSAGADPLDGLD